MKIQVIGTIEGFLGPVAIDPTNGYLAVLKHIKKGFLGWLGTGGYVLYQLPDLNNFTEIQLGQLSPEIGDGMHPWNHLNFSKSGNLLAAAEWTTRCYGLGWIYDIASGKGRRFYWGLNLTPFGNRGGSERVLFSPKGKWLVVASRWVQTVIIDVDKCLKEGKLEIIMGLEADRKMSKRKFFAWSPDGRALVSVIDMSEQGRVRSVDVWSFPNGEESLADVSLRSATYDITYKMWYPDLLDTTSNLYFGLDISVDSCLLAAGGGNKRQGVVQVFDIQNIRLLCESEELPSQVTAVKFIPSSETIVSGCLDGILTLWRLRTTSASTILKKEEEIKVPGPILAIELVKSKDLYICYKDKRNLNVACVSL